MTKARWLGIAILSAGALVTGYALSDQCTRLSATSSQWAWARKHVERAPKVLDYCEPCNAGAAVRKAPTIHHGGLVPDDDLAYVYVQVGDDRYANLAKMVGCTVDDVSPFIDAAGEPR